MFQLCVNMQHSTLDLQDIYKQTVGQFLGELEHVSPGYSVQELVNTRELCFVHIQKLLKIYGRKRELL